MDRIAVATTTDRVIPMTYAIQAPQRLSEMRVCACWQALQVHDSPQLQTSPHWHAAAAWGAGFWQPQVHWAPLQAWQEQTFD